VRVAWGVIPKTCRDQAGAALASGSGEIWRCSRFSGFIDASEIASLCRHFIGVKQGLSPRRPAKMRISLAT
jgi:hypothetical protein